MGSSTIELTGQAVRVALGAVDRWDEQTSTPLHEVADEAAASPAVADVVQQLALAAAIALDALTLHTRTDDNGPMPQSREGFSGGRPPPRGATGSATGFGR